MIATNEAADLLRHGWQEAARSLASDTPGVAEILETRLQRVIAAHQLDEGHLLEAIDDVESALAGSPNGPALARRLRRTVYEYLLALDAARPNEAATAGAGVAPAGTVGPLVGVEEVAALGHPARPAGDEAADAAPAAAADLPEPRDGSTSREAVGTGPVEAEPEAPEPPSTEARGTRRRFVFRRRQPDGELDAATADAAWEASPEATDAGSEPDDSEDWQFAAAADLGSDTGSGEALAAAGAEAAAPTAEGAGAEPAHSVVVELPLAQAGAEAAPPLDEPWTAMPEADSDPATAALLPPAAEAAGHLPEPAEDQPTPDTAEQPETIAPDAAGAPPLGAATAPEDMDPPAEQPSPGATAAEAPPIVVAPRAGFHIVDDDERFEPARPDADVAEAPAPVWPRPASPPSPPPAWTEPAAESLEYDVAAWPSPAAAVAPSLPAPLPPELPAPAPATPPQQPAPHADDDDESARGWRVRDARQAHRSRSAAAHEQTEDDPFQSNAALSDLRRRIEDRLRRKRCDEAASLIQSLAQETGGRAVADLALNAGDRCRALGKHNAALNCYLAASRSDPVYEEPLSRLADVCIDSQDTELAVTYLERIARLQRYRGDDRGALRVLRRIATIAPYREDILAQLMNAQRTGRLD